jgi:hypothetical protein
MIERWSGRFRGWLRLRGVVVGMVAAMALAVALPDGLLPVGEPPADRTRVLELRLALNRVPAEAEVVVGFDADLGTYAELRHATRVLLLDLLDRGASLSFVSYTPEGRLLALAELDRLLRAGIAPDLVVDLGFVPGAEAALVRSVADLSPPGAEPAAPEAGLARFDLALVIGGTDLHPRSWIEQVGVRLPGLPIVAVAPSFLQPELRPYLDSGQLTALLASARDSAAYAAARSGLAQEGPDDRLVGRPIDQLALTIGMLVAIAALLEGSVDRAAGALRRRYRALRDQR